MEPIKYKAGDRVVIRKEYRIKYPDTRYSVLTITDVQEHKHGYQVLTIAGMDEAPSCMDLRLATEAEIACDVQHVPATDPELMYEVCSMELSDSLEYAAFLEKEIHRTKVAYQQQAERATTFNTLPLYKKLWLVISGGVV